MSIEEQIKTNQLAVHKKALINTIYTANFINDEISGALKPFEISIQQFNVLRILKGQKDKPANLSTIQERMVSKMSNTTRIVDKLIEKGFVNRYTCKQNRRKVEILITEDGKRFLEKINHVIEDREVKLTQNLQTEELNQINQLLDKLRES
jgi:DNA-binding MarR family transcriptional regulator